MNNILEFRVWDKTKKRWHLDADGYIGDSEWIGLNELIEVIHRKNFVIQQFTGLCDKNGKKIFAGDIVRYSYTKQSNGIAQIIWLNEKCQFVYWDKAIFDDLSWLIGTDQDYCITKSNMAAHFEVIGNVFENSDLIK